MTRNLKDYALITARGLAMGAADVVPGVSGGTIAFITGIYEEFIGSLKSLNLDALKVLQKEGIAAFWQKVNGWFLVSLFLGVGISLVSLAKGITFLLANYPVLLWSFFFGLIIASSILIGRSIKKWTVPAIIGMLLATGIAYFITVAVPAQTPTSWWFIMLSGAIAICAMILPGISGSFILLLMGKYAFIMGAISDRDFATIGIFGAGCIAGLLSFSHVLSWMFRKFHNLTIAVLTGFMIGSLNKVWPWKLTHEWRVNSHGEEVPFIQESVLPGDFQGEPQVVMAIVMMVVGFTVIAGLQLMAAKKELA